MWWHYAAGQSVFLKLSLPDNPAMYDCFINHPKVIRLWAGACTRPLFRSN